MDLVSLPSLSDPTKRKVLATKAAAERDVAALLELLAFYLKLRSKKRERMSAATFKAYRQGVQAFVGWIWPAEAVGPLKPLLKVESDDLALWLASSSLKPASQALYLSAVLRLYQALKWAGAYGGTLEVSSPTDPTPPEAKRKALTSEAYQSLLSHLPGDSLEGLRDRVAVRLMAESGLRISEVLSLKPSMINLGQKSLRVVGKGGKARVVPIKATLAAELNRFMLLVAPVSLQGFLFINLSGRNQGKAMSAVTLWRKLGQYYRQAGLSEYSGAHLLRHTAATGMYRRSKDLLGVGRILGHASPSTTSIYAKMDQSELHRIVED